MFHNNHGPILYCFPDKLRIQSKITNFPHPLYLTPPLGGSLSIGIGGWGQKTRMMGYLAEKEV